MDHAGLTQTIKGYGAKLCLHKNQLGYPEKMNEFFLRKPDKAYHPVTDDGNIAVTTEEGRILLQNMGISGVWLPTKGHTPDSMSLVLDKDCAFTGDLPHFSVADDYSVDVRESWQLLRKQQVCKIYPAHGGEYTFVPQ